MRAFLFVVALGSIVCGAANPTFAGSKSAGQKPVIFRYDYNQDGKINTMERAALRMTKAQQREWRARARNNAMVR